MRAVVTTPAGTLDVEERPRPDPGPDDVVIAVDRCGICGSDLHMKTAGLLPPGAVMGHEFGGRVAAAGSAVRGLAEGDRVAVLPCARCGVCRPCREGRTQLCTDQWRTALGLGFNDGGYAEYVRTPARACVPLAPAMTAEQAALVEPYAVALHAVRRSKAHPGAVVGVIGAGPIGLLTLAALRAKGVETVAVAERSATRADAARAMGATAVTGDASGLPGALDAEVDVVFECAGTVTTPQAALETVAVGGEVMLVGVTGPADQLALSSVLWIIKEIDVRASIAYTDEEFAEAVDAVARGAVDASRLVSAVRPLEDADAAFADLTGPEPPLKVLLSPQL